MTRRETIAAIASAPGRAAIGIVRLAGPAVPQIIEAIVSRPLVPRLATLTDFRDGVGTAIDRGIAIYFPAPHSYTGEPMLELQGHGGPIVVRTLLQRCLELGARLSEPGEFTRRAFLNGKIDLAQAESVIDLIDASTTHAARAAMRSVKGEFSALIETLQRSLTELRMLVEATLDFPEEEIDVPEPTAVQQKLAQLGKTVGAVLDTAGQGAILRDGLHAVIAGQPNVGKSSLLNRLAGEDLAIVTDIPGTTRDTVRELISIQGIPLHLIDTAGLRDSADPVERAGIDRTWLAIGRADLVIRVIDATRGEQEADREIGRQLPEGLPRIRVMNKIDRVNGTPHAEMRDGEKVVWLSAKSGAGIDLLEEALLTVAGWHSDPESVFSARERHLVALRAAQGHLARAAGALRHFELLAEELRLAQRELSAITGEFSADDLLGEIFSRFCIGK